MTDALTDLPSYDFKTKGFEITAVIGSEGKVVGVTYFSHVMSAQDIDSLLAANAPKAEWQKRASKNSASKGEEIDWIGLEDGSRKYSAWSWTINDPRANADVYGTKVLEIETMEVEELRKSYKERREKALRGL